MARAAEGPRRKRIAAVTARKASTTPRSTEPVVRSQKRWEVAGLARGKPDSCSAGGGGARVAESSAGGLASAKREAARAGGAGVALTGALPDALLDEAGEAGGLRASSGGGVAERGFVEEMTRGPSTKRGLDCEGVAEGGRDAEDDAEGAGVAERGPAGAEAGRGSNGSGAAGGAEAVPAAALAGGRMRGGASASSSSRASKAEL